MKRFTGSFLVLLGAASFGFVSTFVKLAYHQGFTVRDVTSSQIVFGCIGLWLCSMPVWRQLHALSPGTIGKLVASGTFAGLTGIFTSLALQVLSASLVVILLFQFIWMGMLAEWAIQRRPPARNQWIALGILLIGTVLAAGYSTLLLTHINPGGIVLGLLSAVSNTGFILVSGRVANHVQPMLKSALMMTGAMILILIIFPPYFIVNGTLGHGLWIWTLLLALVGSMLPPYLFAKGAPIVGSGLASILGSFELPIVILLSALILRESVAWSQWVGVVLILVGVIVSELKHTSHTLDSAQGADSREEENGGKIKRDLFVK